MKRIIGSLLLFMITSGTRTITAQTNENTIILPNSSWAVLKYGVGSYGIPCCVSTQYVYFDGDSIVAGNAYKKVFSCNDELHENITYEGLLREQDKKTYFIPKDSETEYLLYDFSLEEGMTFEYSHYDCPELADLFYIRNSDIIEINGYLRKRMQLAFLPPYENSSTLDTWVEGIGSLSGILYPCVYMTGGVRELLCHYKNDELIYKNLDYSACYYDKVEDIATVKFPIINSLAVYPNPVDNLLVISSSNEAVSWIEFTDISGKAVYAKHLDAGEGYMIDVSRFTSGLYFLHVYDANGLASTFKIIKR